MTTMRSVATSFKQKVRSGIKHAARTCGVEIKRAANFIEEPPPIGDDVIADEWISNVLHMANRNHRPPFLAHRRTRFGDDQRLKYILIFLDVREQRVLELGPLEGYHSVMLEKLGIRENVAIEGRADNVRKCLRVKELYGLFRTTFVNENLEELFEGRRQLPCQEGFDLVFALGILYHMPDPAAALAWCRTQAPMLFLGTHYFEPTFRGHYLRAQGSDTYVSNGRTYRFKWDQEGGLQHLISGMSPRSRVLYEPDLIRMLHDVGYSRVSVLGKDIQNFSPHITMLAEA